ncbi:MAG: DUF1653 domain-containing protein [Mailhella sp.]|nr:DUF1653 domain-containing protein [Mailhella sp.]
MREEEVCRLQPGDIVKHFKRELSLDALAESPGKYLYEIVSWARHSETDERYVVYRALYGTKEVWVRPFSMFMEEVDREKYPSVKQRYRFELAGREEFDALGAV